MPVATAAASSAAAKAGTTRACQRSLLSVRGCKACRARSFEAERRLLLEGQREQFVGEDRELLELAAAVGAHCDMFEHERTPLAVGDPERELARELAQVVAEAGRVPSAWRSRSRSSIGGTPLPAPSS